MRSCRSTSDGEGDDDDATGAEEGKARRGCRIAVLLHSGQRAVNGETEESEDDDDDCASRAASATTSSRKAGQESRTPPGRRGVEDGESHMTCDDGGEGIRRKE